MVWRIEFAPKARKELGKLGAPIRERIERFLYDRVAGGDPMKLSEPLTGDAYDNLRRFRIGDYRVFAALEHDVLRVLVVRVGHRGAVYKRPPSAHG